MSEGRSVSFTRIWTDRPLAFKGLVVVALPLAILLGSLVSLYLASSAETRAEDDVRRAFAIQRDIYQVHALLAEAATGVRGYALTREDRFLEPYRTAEVELPATLERLDGAIEDPVVSRHFVDLLRVTEEKRASLRATVALAKADETASPEEIEQALIANKLTLDTVRREIEKIQRREAVVLDERRALVDDVRDRFLVLTAVSGLVGLLGSLAAVYLFSTGIVRRVSKLEGNAELLARGERLVELPEEADEIGRLTVRLIKASALLRKREEDLRASEERFRLVIERVRDYGIFTLDPRGTVTSWNLGAERIKGWQAEEILGEHFSRFYPEETRDYLPAQMLERARANGSAEDEGWRVRKDGSRFWANVIITALRDEAGQLQGFAKVTRDMSERRRSEEALKLAREEAIAANLAKSEFLSRTSHELRTPLNAILGFGQLLEIDLESFSPPHQEAVERITRAGRHLLSLINDLLDISSIEAGGAELEPETIDAAKVLGEARDLAEPIVLSAGLRFDLVLPAKPLSLTADRRRLTQVILNLVANAAKYNTQGSFVRMGAQAQGNGAVTFFVEDDGPGIAPGNVARLFTAFDRLGQNQRTKTEGTGLGLALSKTLIQSMGGEIGYTALEPGARFWFRLGGEAAGLREVEEMQER
ncbi:Pdh/DivJ/PleC-related sensor histidine kinase [Erythrobacter litoralis]|uniref:histidine kinase n=1 Tax=Erythrobacter litoralis TaxID=39960 RepID=A0A074M8X8_9SPHN|nr:ATP-binding protein [Erythrobacter litoralis]AOL22762.1 Pdh/DivJ/PleC-related sensor histidine kinase [Erythrobacter litoralis]KEO89874.1 histidine kinase [Erythrobacter litoralis]